MNRRTRMPQLSLYLDEKTLKRVQQAAKISRVSVSKWVANQLRSQLKNDWPDQYFELFGSIADPTFDRPEPMTNQDDATRVAL